MCPRRTGRVGNCFALDMPLLSLSLSLTSLSPFLPLSSSLPPFPPICIMPFILLHLFLFFWLSSLFPFVSPLAFNNSLWDKETILAVSRLTLITRSGWCQTQSAYDRRTPTRFVLDKKKERKAHPLVDHASLVRPFRLNEPTSFRGNDCSMLTGTLCLRVPFARAILSYKRSRTIELPVHHRFHLPRTSIAPRNLFDIRPCHLFRITRAVYSICRQSLASERDPQLASLCMAYVPWEIGKDDGG